jgi:hypothetical protein
MQFSRHGRWSFSLRTLFLVLTLAAVVAWLGWNFKQVRQRDELRGLLRSRGAMFGSTDSGQGGTLPIVWTLFGAQPIGLVELPDGAFSADDVARLATLFPEATIRERSERSDFPRGVPQRAR